MLSRDYLKRQIDQLGKALGKLLSEVMDLRERGKTSLAIETVSQTLKTAIDYDLEFLLEIPEDNFLDRLQREKKLDRYHLDALSNILYEVALSYEENVSPEKAKSLFLRTKIIYDHLNKTDTTYSFERYARAEKIRKKYNLS